MAWRGTNAQITDEMVEFAEDEGKPELAEKMLEVRKHGSTRKAAKALGVAHGPIGASIRALKKRMARQGYSPEHDMTKPVPDGYHVKGTSTLYDEDGKPRMQWVKSSIDHERQREIMLEAVESAAKEVRPYPPIAPPKHQAMQDLMTVYPMGDPHFGMYSWASETGDDFDLDIASHDLYAAVDYLVDRSPPSERGVLINLGDFFHAENMEGMTTRSGHVLDMDTRFAHMIDIGVTTLRRCMDRMLEKHQHVEMINAPGNHDETVALFMSVLFRNLYEQDPRVTVHDSPSMRHYIRHGKTIIGVVHGHQTKDNDLIGIMAAERPKDWGDTVHRYFYRGHHHQDKVQEFNGGKVEQFRTLAAKDAYAAGHGYLSGRDMKCIVHHAEFGEQSRFTCGIDVLRKNQ